MSIPFQRPARVLLLLTPLLFQPLAPLPSRAQQAPPGVTVPTPKPLIAVKGAADVTGEGVKPSSGQVTVTRSQDTAKAGWVVAIQPGKDGYPGFRLEPTSGNWDLSTYSRVEAKVANDSDERLAINLRLDNPGDYRNSNSNVAYVPPHSTGSVTVRFGENYGHPGYALKPAEVKALLVFTGKTETARSFRVISIEAAGYAGEKAPEKPVTPDQVRVKPKGGVLLGSGVAFDATKQTAGTKGATAVLESGAQPGLRVNLPAGAADAAVRIKPPQGRWDLREMLQVRVRVRNAGTQAITPTARLESNGGPGDLVRAAAPLAAGQVQELVIPFAAAKPAELFMKPGQKDGHVKEGTGTKLVSDAVSAVLIGTEGVSDARTLLVESIVADVPPAPAPSPNLGKAPPIPGDWTLTFSDDFEGSTLDRTKWNITSGNYWDQRSHFSKDNVLLGGGKVFLKFEKKRGFQNDNPKDKETDYQTGYLDTLNHFRQRYGYFESRMKLPSAPGMWPAFWLMPDRGPGTKDRSSTANGGMEFDICEPLSRWGLFRYNIAMHFDNYGKDHKSLGSSNIYAQPDKDGFITAGLLWTPGSAIYYANGKEVCRWEDPRIADVAGYIIYTAVSGGWDNDPIDDAKLPSGLIVDYVRVWQRKDLATLPEGKAP